MVIKKRDFQQRGVLIKKKKKRFQITCFCWWKMVKSKTWEKFQWTREKMKTNEWTRDSLVIYCLRLIPYHSQPAKQARLIRSSIRSISQPSMLIWRLSTLIAYTSARQRYTPPRNGINGIIKIVLKKSRRWINKKKSARVIILLVKSLKC